jgi:hypothetical protein
MTFGTLNAQNINIGVKGGLNSYSINSGNSSEFKSTTGIHIGLLGHIHMNKEFALQPELVFSMQGANGRSNSDIKLNYINVPVMFQYMFDNGFRIMAGPQLGFLLSAKVKNNNTSVDVKDSFKSVDLGVGIGASYVHPPSNIGIDARYNFGLTDISENSTRELKNTGFQIGIFYLFNHKH